MSKAAPTCSEGKKNAETVDKNFEESMPNEDSSCSREHKAENRQAADLYLRTPFGDSLGAVLNSRDSSKMEDRGAAKVSKSSMTMGTLKNKAGSIALIMYGVVPTCSEGKNNAEYEEETLLKHKVESITLKMYDKPYDELVEPPTRQKKMVVFLVESGPDVRNTWIQFDRVEFCLKNNWMRHERFVF